MASNSSNATEMFRKQWEIYQTTLDGDYLYHSILFQPLVQDLRSNRSLQLLDLGCGDCSCISRLLKQLVTGETLSGYTGVDLTANALELARGNVEDLQNAGTCSVQLIQSDILDYTQHCKEKFDVVLLSFTIHHLGLEAKAQLLQQVRGVLAPGGRLYIMDIVKREGESLEDFHVREVGDVYQRWMGLDEAAMASMAEHMNAYDIPEAMSTWQRLTQEKGYSRLECKCTTPNDLSRCIVLHA